MQVARDFKPLPNCVWIELCFWKDGWIWRKGNSRTRSAGRRRCFLKLGGGFALCKLHFVLSTVTSHDRDQLFRERVDD